MGVSSMHAVQVVEKKSINVTFPYRFRLDIFPEEMAEGSANAGIIAPWCIPLVSCLRRFSGSFADPPETVARADPVWGETAG